MGSREGSRISSSAGSMLYIISYNEDGCIVGRKPYRRYESDR